MQSGAVRFGPMASEDGEEMKEYGTSTSSATPTADGRDTEDDAPPEIPRSLPRHFEVLLALCGAMPLFKSRVWRILQRVVQAMFLVNSLILLVKQVFHRFVYPDEGGDAVAASQRRIDIIFLVARIANVLALPAIYFRVFGRLNARQWQATYESSADGLTWVSLVDWSKRDEEFFEPVPMGRKSLHSRAQFRKRTSSAMSSAAGNGGGVSASSSRSSQMGGTQHDQDTCLWLEKLREDIIQEWLATGVPTLDETVVRDFASCTRGSWYAMLAILAVACACSSLLVLMGIIEHWMQGEGKEFLFTAEAVLNAIFFFPSILSPLPILCCVMHIKHCTDLHGMEARWLVHRFMVTSKWFRVAAERLQGACKGTGAAQEIARRGAVCDDHAAADQPAVSDDPADQPERLLTRYIRLFEGMRRRQAVTIALWNYPAGILYATAISVALFGTYISVRLSIASLALDWSVLVWTLLAIVLFNASLSGIIESNAHYDAVVPHIHLSRCLANPDMRTALEQYVQTNGIQLKVAGFTINATGVSRAVYPLLTIFFATMLEALKDSFI